MATPAEREAYRHGNLRAAALAAGMDVLIGAGDSPLTVREVARRVGVAHHALYHHFADKAALERALAAAGFHRLAEQVERSQDPAEFVASYARFALAHRRLYDLMMAQQYAMLESDPELRAGAGRVIQIALAVFAPDAPDPESARRVVARTWMLTHGGLMLHATGALRLRDDEAFVAELLRIADLAPGDAEGPQPLWGDLTKETKP
jgi:AcrR family transcriptional regulator